MWARTKGLKVRREGVKDFTGDSIPSENAGRLDFWWQSVLLTSRFRFLVQIKLKIYYHHPTQQKVNPNELLSRARVGTHPASSKNNYRQSHPSEISVPKPSRPVRLRPKILRHSKQPHHQIIHFHILEPIHNVDVVRGRVPPLVLVRHPGLVVQGFHNVRERTMGNEHRVHPEVSVVVSVALENWIRRST